MEEINQFILIIYNQFSQNLTTESINYTTLFPFKNPTFAVLTKKKNKAMKKSGILIGTLLLITVFVSSCKKDYTCSCSKTYTGDNSSTTQDYATYTYKDNRARAESRCNDNEKTDSDLLGTYTINCEIKE